jgi:hypothetical protein
MDIWFMLEKLTPIAAMFAGMYWLGVGVHVMKAEARDLLFDTQKAKGHQFDPFGEPPEPVTMTQGNADWVDESLRRGEAYFREQSESSDATLSLSLGYPIGSTDYSVSYPSDDTFSSANHNRQFD